MKNSKFELKKVGYPDYLASDEEKAKESYGLQMAKAIEHEWFSIEATGAQNEFLSKRDHIHKMRLYARGEQATKIYQDLLNDGEEDSYSNYDWRPIQIAPKFIKLIVNQMTERLFNINAEAIDQFSTDQKEKYRRLLEDKIILKPLNEEFSALFGVQQVQEVSEGLPETDEEIELYMQLNYKPAIEIATEQALRYTLKLNDYDQTQATVIEDIVTLGIGAVKQWTDPNKGIVVKTVDPAKLVYSFPRHKDFRNVHYYGEVEKISINDLKRISGKEYTKDELKEIMALSGEFNKYQGNTNDEVALSDNDDMDNIMVDVLHFNFKTSSTVSYKKKYNKSGGFKMTKKESTFKKKDPNYKGFDAVRKTIDVWYRGTLIMGTNEIINYGLCENMVRPKGLITKALPEYIVYAPDIYQNRPLGLLQRIIPTIDQMQQIHIKLQQLIAKTRPKGIYVDIDGLEELALGDGNVLTPLELIKIYDQTGNVLGATSTEAGEYNHGREPIRELNNGVVQGLDQLIGAYNHQLNQIRDAIGIPQGADASMPHPDTLVGVQEQVALNSNTATRHVLESMLNISERLGESLALRLKDIFKYSNLREVYVNAIGKTNVEILRALENYHLHDLGITIDLKPDNQEKQLLNNDINNALAQGIITLDDAIDIRKIDNIKIANELLKVRRKKREKEQREHELQKIRTQSESQAEGQVKVSQAKQQEIAIKSKADLAVIEAKTEGKLKEIEAEKLAKSELMEKEFDYNMQLKGLDVDGQAKMKKYDNDRKDARQDRNNTQQAKIKEAQQFGTAAPSFESSLDNITGGDFQLSEQEPS